MTRVNAKKIVAFAIGLAMLVLSGWFSGCERTIQLTTPELESRTIGVVLPLTGRYAESFGDPMAEGLELARKEINTPPLGDVSLEFIIEDNRSTVEGTVEAFNKLIQQDDVSVILGPATSSALQAALPLAQENQVVVMSPTAAGRGLGELSDFVFLTALTIDVRLTRGIRATHDKLGYQRVATLYDENEPYAIDADAILKDALTDSNVEVLTSEPLRPDDAELSAQLTQIMALEPEAIFITLFPQELVEVMVQAHQLGIAVPFIATLISTSDIQAAGDAAEGTITVANWSGTTAPLENQAFVRNYRATYGIQPNTWAAQSYATVYILAEAIVNTQSTDAVAIRDALARISDFDTILGKFAFNADGEAIYEPKLLIVKDGEFASFE